MKESERIRREVRAAAEQLTLAQQELDRALGRQEAYRSFRRQFFGPIPEEERAASPEEAFLWSMRETEGKRYFENVYSRRRLIPNVTDSGGRGRDCSLRSSTPASLGSATAMRKARSTRSPTSRQTPGTIVRGI